MARDHEIAVVAEAEGDVPYQFTIEGGPVEKTGSGDVAAEANDAVTDNGDGTITVEGFTGNTGYGDTFAYDGELVSFTEGDVTAAYRIEIDGEDVTDAVLSGEYFVDEPPQCLGISSDGDRCTLDAGYGNDDDTFCMYHDDQITTEVTVAGSTFTAVGPASLLDDGTSPPYTVHVQDGDGKRFAVSVREV